MSILRALVRVVLLLFERWRGPKTLQEVKCTSHALGHLRGLTIRGYEVAIYCHRREYRIEYDRWYIPNRTKMTYNLFSVVSSDAPMALRQACELDIDLPALIHDWNFDTEIRRAHVLAYLDLLEKRMQEHEP